MRSPAWQGMAPGSQHAQSGSRYSSWVTQKLDSMPSWGSLTGDLCSKGTAGRHLPRQGLRVSWQAQFKSEVWRSSTVRRNWGGNAPTLRCFESALDEITLRPGFELRFSHSRSVPANCRRVNRKCS
jgi:hypothetical protein